MSSHFASWDERTLELAVDGVTVGLEPLERARLDTLVAPEDLEDFEHVVAVLHVAHLQSREAPPSDLVRRLAEHGREQIARGGGASTPAPDAGPEAGPERGPSFGGFVAVGGWLAAAASLLVFALGGRDLPPPGGSPSDPATARQALLASGGGLVRAEWSGTDDPLAAGVGGEVVWSPERQEGYMVFRNLAPNDPTEHQYQLWIFDPTRADWEAKPVDGGVFDVSSRGEVVVRIDAKLDIGEPALFAVTLEDPGGVVVSERERLVVTASV